MERRSLKDCSVSFSRTNESVFLRNCPEKEEFNLVFFTSERLVCFEPTKAAKFLKKIQVHSVLDGQGKKVFKGKYCICKGLIDVSCI